MTIGDQSDVTARLKAALPAGWFGAGPTPVLDALLQGPAWALSQIASLIAYAKLQTRIATATDAFLDLAAQDFLGSSLTRRAGQSDTAFRALILSNILREKATRRGLVASLTALTGRVPIVFEPGNVNDAGAASAPLSAGYAGVARAGSLAMPFTAFVTAYRPLATGGVAGAAYACTPSTGGASTPRGAGFAGSLTFVSTSASDADIYAAVDAVRPIGTTVWTAISN